MAAVAAAVVEQHAVCVRVPVPCGVVVPVAAPGFVIGLEFAVRGFAFL
ncbi:hypothetical protein [Clostridium minihomine]|nr:hypothetical protein [Clostridium minihomine]